MRRTSLYEALGYENSIPALNFPKLVRQKKFGILCALESAQCIDWISVIGKKAQRRKDRPSLIQIVPTAVMLSQVLVIKLYPYLIPLSFPRISCNDMQTVHFQSKPQTTHRHTERKIHSLATNFQFWHFPTCKVPGIELINQGLRPSLLHFSRPAFNAFAKC